MELNEMEKRLLFQVEGDYQYKVLNELHMAARYTKDSKGKESKDSKENTGFKTRYSAKELLE